MLHVVHLLKHYRDPNLAWVGLVANDFMFENSCGYSWRTVVTIYFSLGLFVQE